MTHWGGGDSSDESVRAADPLGLAVLLVDTTVAIRTSEAFRPEVLAPLAGRA